MRGFLFFVFIFFINIIYCQSPANPTLYCGGVFPGGSSTIDSKIGRVQILGTTLNNPSTACVTYENFSNIITLLNPGSQYTLVVNGYDCNGGTSYNASISMFIDLNNDKIFQTNEKLLVTPRVLFPSSPGIDYSNNFTIPIVGTSFGQSTLMRVCAFESDILTNGCNSPSSYGQCEDYTVFLGNKVFDNTITAILAPDTLGFCGVDAFVPSLLVKNVGNQTTVGGSVAIKFESLRYSDVHTLSTNFTSSLDAGSEVIVNFNRAIKLNYDDVYKVTALVKNDSDKTAINDTFVEYIQVYQKPNYKFNYDSAFCLGDTTKLKISSEDTFARISRIVWPNQSENDSIFMVFGNIENEINVRIERVKCRIDETLKIQARPLPNLTITSDSLSLCATSDTLIFKAKTVSATNGMNYFKYYFFYDTLDLQSGNYYNIKIDSSFKSLNGANVADSINDTITRNELFKNRPPGYTRYERFYAKVIDTLSKCYTIKSSDFQWAKKPSYKIAVDSIICAKDTNLVKVNDSGFSIKYLWPDQTKNSTYKWPMLDKSDTFIKDSVVVSMYYEGCKWTDTVRTKIIPAPKAIVSASKLLLCKYDSTEISIDTAINSYKVRFNWVDISDTGTKFKTQIIGNRDFRAEVIIDTFGLKCIDTFNRSVALFPKNRNLEVFSNRINNIVCLGDGITLFATGAKSYKWFELNSNTAIHSDSVYTIAPNAISSSKLFRIEGKDENGCVDTSLIRINVKSTNFSAQIDVLNNATICKGDSVQFRAIPNPATPGYLYDFGSLTSNPNRLLNLSLFTIPPGTTRYPILITNPEGCIKEFYAEVTVAEPPKVAYQGTQICQGQQGTISVSFNNNYSYLWENSNPNNEITVSPTATRTYKVTVQDMNLVSPGCSTVLEVPVTVIRRSDVRITSIDTAYNCPTASTRLVASPAGGYFEFSAGPNFIENNRLLIEKLPAGDYGIRYFYIDPVSGCRQDTLQLFKIKCAAGIDGLSSYGHSVLIYPNPIENQVFVDLDLNESGTISANLYNLVGQTIQTKEWRAAAGTSKNQLETQGLSSGVYILELQLNGTTIHREKLTKK